MNLGILLSDSPKLELQTFSNMLNFLTLALGLKFRSSCLCDKFVTDWDRTSQSSGKDSLTGVYVYVCLSVCACVLCDLLRKSSCSIVAYYKQLLFSMLVLFILVFL